MMRSSAAALPPIEHVFTVAQEDVARAVTSEPTAPTIRAEADLRDYLRNSFGAELPSTRCCHGHVTPWEFFVAAYFAKYPVIVLKGSRGLAGKTWTVGLLALTEACVLRADVTVLGGSGAQSQRVHKAMEKFWRHPGSPRHLLKSEPGITKTTFTADNEIIALTASQKSVRGPHPQRLRLDEVDEMDLRIFNSAMGQTMADRGIPAQTVAASTHQNPNGTFTEVLKMAAEKGWPVMEWCYRETLQPHGWLAQSEVDRKRGEMTAQMWRTEVELQEPSAEGRAIDPDAVERMFRRDLGETDGFAGKVEEFEAPAPGGNYATGGDWGKSAHYTAAATLRTDVSPKRFVCLYRNRKAAYHVMSAKYDEIVRRYGSSAMHDAHGVGAVIEENLTVEAEGYTNWQGAKRIALFSEYISAIEKGDIVAPLSEPWYRAHKYVTNDDLYGNGHPPDEFIACALAYRAWHGDGTPQEPVKRARVWGSAS